MKPKKKKKKKSRFIFAEPIKRSENRGSADSGCGTLSTSKSLESSVLFPKERRGEERRGEERRGEERRGGTHNLHYTTLHFLHNTGFFFIIIRRCRVVRAAAVMRQQRLLALNLQVNDARDG